jgi:hypothetical protein
MNKIKSSANKYNFNFFLFNLGAIFPSHRLISFAKISNILNKNDESGHPCLIPDLTGNSSSFPMVFDTQLF